MNSAEEQNGAKTVFIVDDDKAVRDSLSWLISSVGFSVETYDSAKAFLDAFEPGRGGCLIVDVRMPGMSGLELQKYLESQPLCLPVIIITGHGDVQMAVRAMKSGAFDFIEKPFNDQIILDVVQKAVQECDRRRTQQHEQGAISSRMDKLTPREREVLDLIVQGQANKQIARTLLISDKTVEVHRGRVMQKLEATSVAELVRMVLALKPTPNLT